MWQCPTVVPEHVFYTGNVNDTCYEFLPVQVDGDLLFNVPGTPDLIPHSPTVDCHEAVPFIIKTGENEYRSASGIKHVQTVPSTLIGASAAEEVRFFVFNSTDVGAPNMWTTTTSMISHYATKLFEFQQVQEKLNLAVSLHSWSSTYSADDFGPGVKRVVNEFGDFVADGIEIEHGIFSSFLLGPVQFVVNAVIGLALTIGFIYLLGLFHKYVGFGVFLVPPKKLYELIVFLLRCCCCPAKK